MKVINRDELHKIFQDVGCNASELMKRIETDIPSFEEMGGFDTGLSEGDCFGFEDNLNLNPVLSNLASEGAADNEDDFSDYFQTASKTYMLCISDEIASDTEYLGEVFGVGNDESGYYYVLAANKKFNESCNVADFNKKGLIVTPHILKSLENKALIIEGYDFVGSCIDGIWTFHRSNEQLSFMTCSTFGLATNLFSRNEGLFEASEMLEKYAIIIGAGSVGSLIALQLARAGIKKFILIDGDVLKLHNVCRHQLGFRDLGRYKTAALKDAIMNINPLAEVITFNGYLQDAPLDIFDLDKNGMMIGTADNRAGNALANDFAEHLGIPFVATGCWTRAAAGEAFYWRPDSNLPTYREAYYDLISGDRSEAHNNYFGDEEERETLNFEPGTSVDIEFVTNIAIKACLDLLNQNQLGYTPRVLNYLTNSTLICNTNNPSIGGETVTMFPHPLFISHTIRMNKKEKTNDEHSTTDNGVENVGAD